MAATFRTRPWLLAFSVRPTSLSAFSSRALQANMQQSRHAATRSKRMHPSFRMAAKTTMKAQSGQKATASFADDMLQEQLTMNEAETAMLAPRTLVPMPLFKIEGWRDRFWYCKELVFQRFIDRAQIFAQAWRTKPTFFARPKFRAERKGVIEAALKLHAEMSSCLAKGGREEKKHLAKICIPKLSRSLVAAIETRPQGKSYKWELVQLKGSPFWPRLIDHKWTVLDIGIQQSFRQAVVGIKSRQKLSQLGADGMELESKEMDVTEYLVLWRSVDAENLTQGDWKIYGTLKEMTYKDVLKEKEMMQKMGDIMSRRELEETRKRVGSQS
ncbi:hypothetical protein N0V82_004843 [Gnomoniopsis sp. IMI 355080]|nr:hypothetical protein N0V82_004843 [Gnomoniopsis sp. IMI 355080]